MRRRLRAVMAALTAMAALAAPLTIGVAASATADPIEPECFDPRLCEDPGEVFYNPDTGGFGGSLNSPNPGVITGPYAPGGLSPNEGLEGPYN